MFCQDDINNSLRDFQEEWLNSENNPDNYPTREALLLPSYREIMGELATVNLLVATSSSFDSPVTIPLLETAKVLEEEMWKAQEEYDHFQAERSSGFGAFKVLAKALGYSKGGLIALAEELVEQRDALHQFAVAHCQNNEDERELERIMRAGTPSVGPKKGATKS